MFSAKEGTTERLLQYCAGYFLAYVVTGYTVKYFLGNGLKGMEFLVYSTTGGVLICTSVVFLLGWQKLLSNDYVRVVGIKMPRELLYIIPSGVCTAIVIPTTTLMYSFKGISVMVAMVIMRGAIIVVSRTVDAVQIRQGILKKAVYWEENVAVCVALAAVSTLLFGGTGKGSLFTHAGAMVVLGAYLVSYAIRIYIMNYYKNTRPKEERGDNRGFFAAEQIAAAVTIVLVAVFLFNAPTLFETVDERILTFHAAIVEPRPSWFWAILAGTAFGVAAFFSVFIYMFKGRTATFAALVNRLTSLVAGTTSTLLFALFAGGKYPTGKQWASFGLIIVAVVFLSRAEKKRAKELAEQGELSPSDEADAAPSTIPVEQRG